MLILAPTCTLLNPESSHSRDARVGWLRTAITRGKINKTLLDIPKYYINNACYFSFNDITKVSHMRKYEIFCVFSKELVE